MKVALLQMRLNPKSGAANLQHLIVAIHSAVAIQPPPDLLILPGACDTGGVAVGRGQTAASLLTVYETLAWKAREWGIYIAAGLHACLGGSLLPLAVLFDPDGDVLCRHGPACPPAYDSDTQLTLWKTWVGPLGVADAATLDVRELGEVGALAGALIAVPAAPCGPASRRRAEAANLTYLREEASARRGAYWGVASAVAAPGTDKSGGKAGRQAMPGSFLCAPDGALLASAAPEDEIVLYADVPLDPAPFGDSLMGVSRDE